MTGLALVVVTAVGVVGAGCSGDDDSAEPPGPTTTGAAAGEDAAEAPPPDAAMGSYVGMVEVSNAYMAIVVAGDGQAMAYVTDGGVGVDWVDGVVEGDTARLGNDGGALLEVTFAGDGASGRFRRGNGDPLPFTAEAADEPAGLYRAEQTFADGLYVAGWVVLDDGTQKGAVRRYETPLPAGEDAPVLDLDLDALSIEVPGGTLHPVYVDPTRL